MTEIGPESGYARAVRRSAALLSVACLAVVVVVLNGCGSSSEQNIVAEFVSVQNARHYFASRGVQTQCEGREFITKDQWEEAGRPKEHLYGYVLCKVLKVEGTLMETERGQFLTYGLSPK